MADLINELLEDIIGYTADDLASTLGDAFFEAAAGNQVERLFNDVPCNEKEFAAKIAEICDEDTFKKITSPTFFVSKKADKQKSDLMRMAGEITDVDIATGNPEFEMLLGMLGTACRNPCHRPLSLP